MTAAVPSLVAPAGGPGALQAAVAHGADAVYLGLRHLSARAHAANFALEQLAPAVSLAHAGGCEVLVTLNTLLRGDELNLASRLLQACQDASVDAVVVQDVGMIALAHQVAPDLRLHGSTQLAIHSSDGAAAAARLGLRRVVLARELSLNEIAAIRRAVPDVELEVFAHGSLCYAYSGLCLASAMAEERRRGRASRGRSAGGATMEPSLAMASTRSFSGNRGRCTQPCRRPFHSEGGDRLELGLPFSLRDLVGLDLIPQLAEAGVAALKIEGRLRSPAYVAAACHAYRGALDQAAGRDPPPGWTLEDAELALRSLFSRKASTGYLVGAGAERGPGLGHPPVKVQPLMQGHMGPRVGQVLGAAPEGLLALVERPFAKGDRLLTADASGRLRHLELRWLQDEQGGQLGRAEAGDTVLIPAPGRFEVPADAELRLAHSPGTAERFAHQVQPLLPPDFRGPPVQLSIITTEATLEVVARAGGRSVRDRYQLGPEPVDALRAPIIEEVMAVVEGETTLGPVRCEVTQQQPLRTPRKALVRVRRDILRRLALELELGELEGRYAAAPSPGLGSASRPALPHPPRPPTVHRTVGPQAPLPEEKRGKATGEEAWILRSDRPALLALGPEAGFGELELALDPSQPERLDSALAQLDPATLACLLPPVLRGHDRQAIAEQIACARKAGVRRWVLANLGHGALVGDAPAERRWGDDLLYAANPLACATLCEALSLAGITLPLELDRPGAEHMLALAPGSALVVWSDVAVFRSALPPHLPAAQSDTPVYDELEHPYHRARQGRTSVLVDGVPLCLAPHLEELRQAGARRFRVDLCWRPYEPEAARELLARLRACEPIAGSAPGNWTRRWL